MITSALIAVSLLASSQEASVIKQAVKEVVEWIAGREGASAAAELAPRIEKLIARYGQDAARALKASGSPGVAVLERGAGKAMLDGLERGGVRFAEEALTNPSAVRRVVEKCGAEAAEVVARHPGVGARFLEAAGKEGLEAAKAVTTESLEKMTGLLGRMKDSGQLPGFIAAIRKYGDPACKFIWDNKGSIFVAATAAAFVKNPKAFLDPVKDLVKDGTKAAGAAIPWGWIVPLLVAGGILWIGPLRLWTWVRSRFTSGRPAMTGGGGR